MGFVTVHTKTKFDPNLSILIQRNNIIKFCTKTKPTLQKVIITMNASKVRAFVPRTGARPVVMGLPQTAWVKLNRLRTGVGRFHSSMHKWDLAPSPNCECGASEQTADYVLTTCPIHRVPHGARGLTVLKDETRCCLNNTTASN